MIERLASFEDITADLVDVAAQGDQIVAEQAPQPFGTELLVETDETFLRLGDLACLRRASTQVDDSDQRAELYTGFEPVAEAQTNARHAASLL